MAELKITANNFEKEALQSPLPVSSIPTVVVIRDGKVVRTSVGYKPKEALAALLA